MHPHSSHSTGTSSIRPTARLLVGFVATIATLQAAKASEPHDYSACLPQSVRFIDNNLDIPEQSMTWDHFKQSFIDNDEFASHHAVTVEVAEVPCALRGCCTMLFTFRPRTSDVRVFEQVFHHQFFKSIYAHLHSIQPEYILDGGGNVGYSAVLFALLWPSSQIISVEPDRHNFAIHRQNTNRFPNVHAVNGGLWDKQAYIAYMASDDGEWGHVFKEVDESQPGTVAGTTIALLMEHYKFERLDLAKIDVEGAEVRVFSQESDLSWLDHTRILCLELHDRMAHYYGLEQVSDVVYNTMAGRPFTEEGSGEHVYFLHHEVTGHNADL